MLRILLITPEVPYPPKQGASLRNFYILKGLAERHEVSLFSASGTKDHLDRSIDSPLDDLCRHVRIEYVPERTDATRLSRLLTLNSPDMAHRFQGESLIKALVDHLDQTQGDINAPSPYDIIQVEGLELAHLIPVIRHHSPASRIVYDAHNAETGLQRRALDTDLAKIKRWPAAAYSFVQVRRLDRYESWACESADTVTAVSDSDAKYLSRYTHGKLPSVVPNCIDIKEYDGSDDSEIEPSDILFMGKMDYRPNVDAVLWFNETIWPLIKEKRPETRWLIVGQKPHSRLDSLKSSPGIEITGFVDQVQPYLAGTKVVILPLRMGSGTRLKLLQALASSKTVVSTTIGAEGFPGIGDGAIVIQDDPGRFADSVLALLDDEHTREDISSKGRTYANTYDWRQVIPKFDAVYDELLTGKDSAAS